MTLVPTSSQGGQVTSVFSRTGAVVAASNDYTDAQVQNSPTNVLTATGDILYASAANTLARLAKGSDTNVLTLASGLPSWAAPSAGALVLLSSTNLNAGAGTFDVSSISQSYNDLVLVIMARGTAAAGVDNLWLRLNNDSSSNYTWEQLRGNGASAVATQAGAGVAQFQIAGVPANTATASYFGTCTVEIPDYTNTNFFKSVQAVSNWCTAISAGNNSVNTGVWISTAAVNRVQLLGGTTANLAQFSTLRIYGRL